MRLSLYEWFLVSCFLTAIVCANLAVATWGQAALPFTAVLLIPFDMVIRDVLHSRWEETGAGGPMAILILAGAVLSTAFAPIQVAVACFIAFASAQSTNTVVYAIAKRLRRWPRMNVSNLAASIVDSVAFPIVAFGAISPSLSATQAAAKFAGGVVISSLFLAIVHANDHKEHRV